MLRTPLSFRKAKVTKVACGTVAHAVFDVHV